MRKEKILIDGRLISDKPTGISRYCLELIKSYIEAYGAEYVYVLCNEGNSHLCSNPVIVKYKPYHLLHYIMMSFWLRKSDFTLFHSSTYSGLFFKIKSLKNIVTVHDVFYRIVPNFFSENKLINYLAIVYYNFIIKHSLKSATLIISVSKTTRDDVNRFFKKESVVVAEGVNRLDQEKSRTIKKKNYFLYVGNLRKQKNIQLLIDIFSLLPNQNLIVCGNNQGLKESWKSIPNINFMGFVTDEELIDLYSSCKAFIFPSFYEGFGLPVLEAIALDAIVFSSTGGALKEFENANIFHFDPDAKEELIKLIESAGELSFNKEQADIILKEYSWDTILADMQQKNKLRLSGIS